jgi:hypothetical protein
MDRSHDVVLVPIRDTIVSTSWAKTNVSKSGELLTIDCTSSHSHGAFMQPGSRSEKSPMRTRGVSISLSNSYNL